MPHLTLKQGDTVPDFVAGPDDLAGLERELTGDESIRFYMEHDETGDLIVNQPVTEVRESQPEIVYDFSAGETSRQGMHYAELVVTYADGDVETVRDDGYFEVDITEPTARDVPPEDLDDPDITVGVVDASEVRAPTLSAVETLTGSLTGGQTVSNLVGENHSIDDDGNFNAADTDTQLDPGHTNPTYDSDEDGTLDAPYDGPSVDTDELSVNTHAQFVQRTQPSDPAEDDVWVDIGDGGGGTKVYQLGAWHLLANTPPPFPSAAHRYSFDAGTGSTVEDDIGDADGTVNGATWVANSQWIGGSALDFDGDGDNVSFPLVPEIGVGESFAVALTISAGTVPTSGPDTILNQTRSLSDRFAITLTSSGNISGGCYDGSNFIGGSSGPVSAGTLYRVVYNFTGSGGDIYLNTAEQTGTDLPSTGTDNGFILGDRTGTDRAYGGIVDDMVVFSDTLSTSEIQSDHDRQPWS